MTPATTCARDPTEVMGIQENAERPHSGVSLIVGAQLGVKVAVGFDSSKVTFPARSETGLESEYTVPAAMIKHLPHSSRDLPARLGEHAANSLPVGTGGAEPRPGGPLEGGSRRNTRKAGNAPRCYEDPHRNARFAGVSARWSPSRLPASNRAELPATQSFAKSGGDI